MYDGRMRPRTFILLIIAVLIIGALGYLWYEGRSADVVTNDDDNAPHATLEEQVQARFEGAAITLPERPDVSVVIEKKTDANGETMYGAEYQNELDASDRAFFTFRTGINNFAAYFGEASGNGNAWVAIPFYVNYGGTGTFLYVGLFELRAAGPLVYHDAVMIDDRAPVVSIAEENGAVVLEYATRHAGQGMASEAKTPAYALLVREGSDIKITMQWVNANRDAVRLDTPKPEDTVARTFTAKGSAVGWYFEASFPIRVTDDTGVQIGQGIAQAQGEWMTTEHVPFVAQVEVGQYKGPAWLVMMRDNASGLPEKDASVSIPITIR